MTTQAPPIQALLSCECRATQGGPRTEMCTDPCNRFYASGPPGVLRYGPAWAGAWRGRGQGGRIGAADGRRGVPATRFGAAGASAGHPVVRSGDVAVHVRRHTGAATVLAGCVRGAVALDRSHR